MHVVMLTIGRVEIHRERGHVVSDFHHDQPLRRGSQKVNSYRLGRGRLAH